MPVERTANAHWEGSLANGSGTVSTGSGVVQDATVKWSSRAEQADENTSPEELIAAAHATCVSMALSAGLAKAGTPPTKLETDVVAAFEGGVGITKLAITVRGDVPSVDENAFREAAEQAKENCPVSTALKGNVEMTVDAALT